MSFQNAHHFSIESLNIASTILTQNVIHPPSTLDPMSILLHSHAVEATHTSQRASYAPKCHPGTRAMVTGHLVDLAIAPAVLPTVDRPQLTSIVWFQGPAGGGKTCIMREVAKRLTDAGAVIATYFFSNRVPGLSSEGPFVATIVYQLLCALPSLKPVVLGVVAENPHIFRESVETQMSRLILKPLARMLQQDEGLKVILLVDGFDECLVEERGHLLQVLRNLVTSTPVLFIIIASRPEFDIRTAFAKRCYESVTHFVQLQDYEDGSEVRHYLCDEFNRIKESHPAKASIPASWPAEDDLQVLVNKSSGNYILPSTVLKYVENHRRNPIQLLQDVMNCFEAHTELLATHPLSPLDALYTMILHPPETDIPLLKRLLHCVSRTPPPIDWSTGFLDELFELEPGSSEIVMCDVHSVVGRPEWGGRIVFHHATLHDFLSNQSRSQDLFQSERETLLDVVCGCARHLEHWSRLPTDTGPGVQLYASLRLLNLLDTLFEAEPVVGSEPYPDTLLQFDARLILKYRFHVDVVAWHDWGPALRSVAQRFEGSSNAPNSVFRSTLARSLRRLRAGEARLSRYMKSHTGKKLQMERLRCFEPESGLYDEPL